ncbi:long-chain-fatty-acid--CoA ligase [Paenirhodobacter sp.]|uniref:long-chain-fatty-acid--CoA ligase n=1 Tax=Paenirhodobacter sp. TaxID=1965326 RepID=UPI003B3F1092
MLGLMMNTPLLVSSILRHAENYNGDSEIVSRTVEGGTHRYSYADMAARAKKVANALAKFGLSPGDRVGTLAWNGYRHLELYYGISGAGYVCHTINPRLFHDQIEFIISHAGDQILFSDLSFLPILESLAPVLKGLKAVVILTDRAHMPVSEVLDLLCYEELIADESDSYDWPEFDENTACALCYTSGTSGAPKGVLYSHRSVVLHAMASSSADIMSISSSETVCPVVPMFHVNAWGMPYSVPMIGAKLVLPGAKLDGASLFSLFEEEGVTITAGVPTVWMGLLDWMDAHGRHFTTLKRAVIGGSAPAPALITRFRDKGVNVRHAWGMTETSPIGLASSLKPKHAVLDDEARLMLEAKQGRPVFGMEFRIEGTDGNPVPRDGKSYGAMLVRGPWVAAGYFNTPESPAHSGGWFDTGDVVTMDADGFVQIVDRNKDVVKSGGEWISSIELENIAQSHSAVKEAAVVARADARWGERPVLVVVLRDGARFTRDDMVDLFTDRISKWSIPEDLVVVDELPHTATGKLLKMKIREIVAARFAAMEPDDSILS